MTKPTILKNPEDKAVKSGEDASLNVSAKGKHLRFTWRKHKDGSNHQTLKKTQNYDIQTSEKAENEHTSTLTIKSVSQTNIGQYSCTIDNMAGRAYSKSASVTLSKRRYLELLKQCIIIVCITTSPSIGPMVEIMLFCALFFLLVACVVLDYYLYSFKGIVCE